MTCPRELVWGVVALAGMTHELGGGVAEVTELATFFPRPKTRRWIWHGECHQQVSGQCCEHTLTREM